MRIRHVWAGMFLLAGFCGAAAVPALAAPGDKAVSCANGRAYVFRPQAVTLDNDIVTARLLTSRHRGVKLRLVPMADGYRYAGRGVWLDGVREAATLNIWKGTAVACDVR